MVTGASAGTGMLAAVVTVRRRSVHGEPPQ